MKRNLKESEAILLKKFNSLEFRALSSNLDHINNSSAKIEITHPQEILGFLKLNFIYRIATIF